MKTSSQGVTTLADLGLHGVDSCGDSDRIVLNGVMTAEDAALAAEHPIDAIVAPNYGGPKLDGTVRMGTDVIKVMALQMLRDEIQNAMVQPGVGRIVEIRPGLARRSVSE